MHVIACGSWRKHGGLGNEARAAGRVVAQRPLRQRRRRRHRAPTAPASAYNWREFSRMRNTFVVNELGKRGCSVIVIR